MAEFHITTNASAAPMPSMSSFQKFTPQTFEEWVKANVKEYPVTLDIGPELQQWIGKIVSYWALAEWIQAGTLTRLLNTGRKEGRVMFGVRLGNCSSRIKQLMEIKDIPIPADLDTLSKTLTECEEARNLLGHGVWLKDPETGEICVQNPAGEWKADRQALASRRKYPEAFSVDGIWLTQTLEKIKGAVLELQKLDTHINTHLSQKP